MLTSDSSIPTPVVVHSIFAPESLAALIGSRYALASPVRCEFHQRGVQDTYRVWSGDRTYALRVYKAAQRTPAQVRGELAVLRHLSSRAVQVARPCRDQTSQLHFELMAPEGARTAILFEWAPGEPPSYSNAAHAALYGSTAARLHAAGDDFEVSELASRAPINAASLLEVPLGRMRALLRISPEAEDYFEALAARLRARLADFASRGLTQGLCHGDLHGGNACVDSNAITLFDFDFCAIGFQVWDLATYRWASRLRGKEQHAWPPFLAAYRAQRALSSADVASIAAFVIARMFWLMGEIHAHESRFDGNAGVRDFLPQAMAFCRALEPEAFGTHEQHKPGFEPA